ncbi:MAG TPA: hypothetical protein VKT73_10265 [Xanthobacteraceae bacterium]|nr:hypothetical protein [Xanthobacteraceae bacterium]
MTRAIQQSMAMGLFFLATATPSSGLDRHEQRSVYASVGREARIASYGAPDAACKGGPRPQIEIAERPSYGTLVEKPVRIIAERSSVPRRDHPCVGKFIDAIAIYYRPTPGFRGSDRLRLRVRFDDTMLEEEILVSVR